MVISAPMAGLPARASLIVVNNMMDELILGQETPDNNAPWAEPKPRKAINCSFRVKYWDHGD
jgi:hypothetical protein